MPDGWLLCFGVGIYLVIAHCVVVVSEAFEVSERCTSVATHFQILIDEFLPDVVVLQRPCSPIVGPTDPSTMRSPINSLPSLLYPPHQACQTTAVTKMSRQASAGNAHNLTHNAAKNDIENHGGPLHFPADDELKPTDTMQQTSTEHQDNFRPQK